MGEITRREFFTRAAAITGAVVAAPMVFGWEWDTESQGEKLGVWQRDHVYRNAVRFKKYYIQPLSGVSIEGDNPLEGNEEWLGGPPKSFHKTPQEILNEKNTAKDLLIDWAARQCRKAGLKPRRVELQEKEFDWGHYIGIAIKVWV